MKLAALTTFALLAAGAAHAQPAPGQDVPMARPAATRPSGPIQQKVAPGLARYTDEVLFGEIWPSPRLSPRDRSLVVISVLIATNKPAQLQGHLGRALDNGVTPVEASGVLTHLALYSGWPNAVSALEVYDQVYTRRQVDLAVLQAPGTPLPPSGAARMDETAPRFAELTRKLIVDDLWRRPDLSVRDRSLVTIAALAAMGEAEQLPAFLRRGRDAGLTEAQIGEALTHLAFYAGWPRATKALEVSARAFSERTGPRPAAGPPASSNFTGAVAVTTPFSGTGGSRLGGATVSFEPSARTNWHTHPLGQLLVVTAGRGWTQVEGRPVRVIRPGDVVWTPPGARHWHGGTRTNGLTHVAIAENDKGVAVQWLEPVSEEEFRGPE